MAARTSLAAGEMTGYPVGMWVNLGYTDSSNDFVASAFESDRFSGLMGLDLAPSENVLIGVAFGAESADVKTAFNRGEADVDGLTIAPYIGVGMGNFSADAAAGYTGVRIDQFRIIPGTSTRISSHADGRRWFASGNLHYSRGWGDLLFTGSAGVVYTESRTGAFTESNGVAVGTFDSKLGQVRLSAELAYDSGAWEPFARATLEHDYKSTDLVVAGAVQPDLNETGGQIGMGIRYLGSENFSASFEASTLVGRGDFDETSINGLVRIEF